MYTLSVYIAGEIDLLENLEIVHITLLVARDDPESRCRARPENLNGIKLYDLKGISESRT